MQYMFVCVSSEAKSVHPMLKPYLWGTSHLFAPAECFLVSFPWNLRSASLIEYHNFLHLHSPFFADFFFRFISFILFSLKSAHRVFLLILCANFHCSLLTKWHCAPCAGASLHLSTIWFYHTFVACASAFLDRAGMVVLFSLEAHDCPAIYCTVTRIVSPAVAKHIHRCFSFCRTENWIYSRWFSLLLIHFLSLCLVGARFFSIERYEKSPSRHAQELLCTFRRYDSNTLLCGSHPRF